MKILLLCSGGMSTTLLVNAMKKAAGQQNIQCEINAAAASMAEELVPQYDAILVAPQVRHKLSSIKEAAITSNRPIALIPPDIYGQIEGEKALDFVKDLIKSNDESETKKH